MTVVCSDSQTAELEAIITYVGVHDSIIVHHNSRALIGPVKSLFTLRKLRFFHTSGILLNYVAVAATYTIITPLTIVDTRTISSKGLAKSVAALLPTHEFIQK